jgi:F-type H+-transporting ATPase subunit epsilon
MADDIQLRIVTPREMMLDEPVLEVTAPGTAGEFGVLPNHITFLSSLEPGVLSFRSARGARRLAVRGGFAEVVDNVMTVLVDAAQFSENIDRGAAETDLRTAERQLETLSPTDTEYAAAQAEQNWAQARLDAVKH